MDLPVLHCAEYFQFTLLSHLVNLDLAKRRTKLMHYINSLSCLLYLLLLSRGVFVWRLSVLILFDNIQSHLCGQLEHEQEIDDLKAEHMRLLMAPPAEEGSSTESTTGEVASLVWFYRATCAHLCMLPLLAHLLWIQAKKWKDKYEMGLKIQGAQTKKLVGLQTDFLAKKLDYEGRVATKMSIFEKHQAAWEQTVRRCQKGYCVRLGVQWFASRVVCLCVHTAVLHVCLGCQKNEHMEEYKKMRHFDAENRATRIINSRLSGFRAAKSAFLQEDLECECTLWLSLPCLFSVILQCTSTAAWPISHYATAELLVAEWLLSGLNEWSW